MRIGVIGAGVIGALRARTVAANRATELAGIADVRLDAAKQLAASLRTTAFGDYREMLSTGRLDAVIVSSPVHLHAEMCLDAISHGCHVLCEKPLANTEASCREIISAARAAERWLAVGFNHRFLPSFQYMKRCLVEGRIGRLDHLRVYGGHDGLGNFRQEWMYRRPWAGGGALFDVGIHMTDLARFMAGEIETVFGLATNKVWNVDGSEDNAMAIFTAQSGASIQYQASWTEWKGYGCFIEAYGDMGMVRASYGPMRNLLITQDKPGGPRRHQRCLYPQVILREKLRGWKSTTQQTFAAELADFLKMLGGESVHLADGRAGLKAVEIAEAVLRSGSEGRAIHLTAD